MATPKRVTEYRTRKLDEGNKQVNLFLPLDVTDALDAYVAEHGLRGRAVGVTKLLRQAFADQTTPTDAENLATR